MKPSRSSLLLATCAALAACASGPGLPEARCRAAGAAAELGKPLDDHRKELARMGAGAVRTEVIPYGVPVTQRGIDPQRLNIEVDQNRIIQRLRCG